MECRLTIAIVNAWVLSWFIALRGLCAPCASAVILAAAREIHRKGAESAEIDHGLK